MPSVTLKPEDKTTIKKALVGNKILTATVARLYVAYPDPNAWTYTKIMGAAVFVRDNAKNSFFFKVVDLMGDRGILWEQELYKDFQYIEETSFFHTFALDEYLAAFSFANEQEARSFYKRVLNKEKLPSKPKKSQKENKNNGGGIFGTKKKKKKGKIDKSDIGAPTEFRHLGHIGWDDQKGFNVQNIDPEWKDLIDQLGDLGISKETIEENVEFINKFLKTKKKEPQKAAKKGPPPQPPSRRAAPPPPAKKKSPPPPPARRPVSTSIRDTLQPSSPVKNSISPPASPSFSPKVSPKVSPTPIQPPPPPPPPPISAPLSQPPPIPPTLPSRSTPQQAPPPPPPPVRPPPAYNNTPPPVPPARITNSIPPPLPPSRNTAPQATAPPSPPPPPPLLSTGGPPPPPPPPPPPSTGGPPPPPPPPPPPSTGGPPPPPPPPPSSIGGPPPPPQPPTLSREVPQLDARANLMEAIRNRGGVGGGGLRSVGEPVRQSTFTEEPSSPTGDTNLAKTLADALKKLNKDMGSDESDDDDDDEWDTD